MPVRRRTGEAPWAFHRMSLLLFDEPDLYSATPPDAQAKRPAPATTPRGSTAAGGGSLALGRTVRAIPGLAGA